MARGNQMVRQWQILQLLQNSRMGLRFDEIAEQLDPPVSERTLFRDLNVLSEVFGAHSDDGRWHAPDKQRVSMPLSDADALGLSLCVDMLAPMGRGLKGARGVEELRTKVEAALPETARRFVAELRGTQVATFTAPTELRDEIMAVLEEGCHLEQSVHVVYHAPGKPPTERLIDPYLTWFADGRLYVIAYCHLRQDFRCLAVARVQEAELTDETFERVPDFDERAYVKGGFGVWPGEAHEVELLFTPEVAHLAEERRFHDSQACTAMPDGGIRMRLRLSGLPTLARWVAGTGGAVRAVAPVQLVAMVRDIHLAGLEACGIKPPARATPGAHGPRLSAIADD